MIENYMKNDDETDRTRWIDFEHLMKEIIILPEERKD